MPAVGGRRGVVDQAPNHLTAGAITTRRAAGPITTPRGLLAVVRGVVLDEALDELVDGAGLGQAALAGLVGQLVLGQALVALTGLVVGLLALPRGLPGLLPLSLLGRLTGLGLDPLRLRSLVAGRPLEGVDAAAGGVGDALHLLAHGAADRLDLLAGDASQRVGNLGQGAGVLVVEVHDPLDEREVPGLTTRRRRGAHPTRPDGRADFAAALDI